MARQHVTTPFSRAIGHQLRTALVETGVSQQELADRAGVDRRVVSRIVVGKANVTIDYVERLFAALGLELGVHTIIRPVGSDRGGRSRAPQRPDSRASAAV